MFDPEETDEEGTISNWNYRLFEGEDGYLTIGEVYYNRNGEPMAFASQSVCPTGSSVEEMIQELKAMLQATDKPIFDRKTVERDWADRAEGTELL